MPDQHDNFYTFSAMELAQIKADYRLLLADKHAHNQQFQDRDEFWQQQLSKSITVIRGDTVVILLAIGFLALAVGLVSFLTMMTIGAAGMLLGVISLVLIKRKQNDDQRRLALFPTETTHFYSDDHQVPFQIQQMIKLPDYLLVYPKDSHLIPTPDQVTCWIIRKTDQPTLYDKLSTTYYHNLLKNPKARRWADYWLVDGTTKEDH